MRELHLKGYINTNYDNEIVLQKELGSSSLADIVIVAELVALARTDGTYLETNKGLGGYVAQLDNCNLRIYYTDKECDLVAAMLTLDNKLFGNGDMYLEVEYEGYSEYTITGIDIVSFMIGGHALKEELLSHKNKYCHFMLDVR